MIGVGRAGPLGFLVDDPETGPDVVSLGRRARHSPIGGAPTRPTVGPRDAISDAERDAWTVLTTVDGLGPVTFGSLLRRYGTGRAVLETASRLGGQDELARVDVGATDLVEEGRRAQFVGQDLAGKIAKAAASRIVILERVTKAGLTVVTLEDPAFPPRLLSVEMPPHLLFVRGDIGVLSLAQAVAIVGTRRPTEVGRRVAARIAAAVGEAGAGVVSGLAVGIDGAAHAAAVAAGRPTIAVLGGGHGQLYPRAHERLADEIVATGGAIVSEFAPDVAPTAGTFPRRNRLISGLAQATVVVEAALRSGALITADWALQQGRGCFIVPGPIDAPTSAGCLAFLRESGEARIVASVAGLIEDLGLGCSDGVSRNAAAAAVVVQADMGAAERTVADLLVAGLTTADELVVGSGLPVASVLGTLTLLEMRGLVIGAYGRYRPAGLLAVMEAGQPQP